MTPETRKDYTIRPNQQTNRNDPELWDVVAGRGLVTICRGKEKAQATADALNKDPYFLDRGQTRADRIKGAP